MTRRRPSGPDRTRASPGDLTGNSSSGRPTSGTDRRPVSYGGRPCTEPSNGRNCARRLPGAGTGSGAGRARSAKSGAPLRRRSRRSGVLRRPISADGAQRQPCGIDQRRTMETRARLGPAQSGAARDALGRASLIAGEARPGPKLAGSTPDGPAHAELCSAVRRCSFAIPAARPRQRTARGEGHESAAPSADRGAAAAPLRPPAGQVRRPRVRPRPSAHVRSRRWTCRVGSTPEQ